MSYKHTAEKLADYRRQIRELRQKMRGVQAVVEPEPVKDYTFRRADGRSVRLFELFGDKADLFVIHNMGQSCPYCTLWADGFNGAYAHGGIVRVSDASFSPGDDFCSVWHFFDLIPEGAAGWQPKYNYA